MSNRLERSWELVKASASVLRQDKELLLFPLISSAALLLVALCFLLPAVGLGALDGLERENLSAGHYLVAFLFYFSQYFVIFFFNAGLVGAALIRLDGGDPTFADGMRIAKSKIGVIAGYAAVAATVGMILRAIQERSGILGRVVAGIIGIAWNAITFFVVPVLLYEPVTAPEAIKRSATIFRARWGEQFTGNATIGLAMVLVGIAVSLPLIALAAAAPVIGIPLLVLAVGAVAAAGAACSGVFNAALYRYAVTGEAAAPFTHEDLDRAFKPKRGHVDTRPPLPPPPPPAP
jgi:hypothetical protein